MEVAIRAAGLKTLLSEHGLVTLVGSGGIGKTRLAALLAALGYVDERFTELVYKREYTEQWVTISSWLRCAQR